MFKLQKLEITGFKSFADYTELVFTGSGITAVVGPNGCGKSNVADAIAWVLGEQRVKMLRGAEMKDVIFQGSRNRLPSGMAEVVLHMVRDETAEEEPDIDDIDSALEEIDDQTDAVEQRLAPEIIGELASSDAAATPAAPDAPIQAETADGNAAVVQAEAVVSAEAQQPGAVSEEALEPAAPKPSHPHHKRHWRPRRMELDFAPGETVAVTRRLYRSGESEYLLNGRVCRLRDIQDLFSGTGLSGAHYAIIEQGRIGQILSAKPMDRRTLIEEAAGITKFRVRQRAAEARLEGARSNLSRVSDIISEIDRQVNSLRRQAGKARRYQQAREELRGLLRQTYAADESALNSLLETLRAEIAAATDEAEALSARLTSREEEARRATSDARAVEDELSEARAAVAESTLRQDRRERERAYQEEQAAGLERRAADVRQEIEQVRARLALIEREGEGLRLTDAQLREESEASAGLLAEAEAAHARRLAEVSEAEAVIETARAELLTHTAVVERLREIGRQLESALDKLAVQAEGLAREGERAQAAHTQAQAQAEVLAEEIASARARLERLAAEREERARLIAEAREVVAETSAHHARVRDEVARVRHRLDTLEEIDAQRSLYPQAVQRILSDASAEDPPKEFRAIGTLADVLRVEPHWELAVESVFATLLQSVIVPSADDALAASAWLEATGAGRANFLVAGLHGGAGDSDEEQLEQMLSGRSLAENVLMEGVELRAWNLLGAPREIAAVLRRTVPREMNARVVQELEQAIRLSLTTEEMCVTPAGEWVVQGQLVAAGGPPVAGEGAGLLSFKREMRELGARAVGLEADLIFAEEAATAARTHLGELEDAYVLLNEAIGREEREQVARELTQAQLTQEIERAERHIRVVADDAARLAEERRALEERRDQQATETETVEAARVAAAEAIAVASEALAGARRAAEEAGEHLSRQRAAAAAAAERRRSTASELRRMESESADLTARLARHEAEVSETEARALSLRGALAVFDEGAEEFEGERERLEREVEEAAGRLAEARALSDALAAEVGELHQQVAAAREARSTFEVQRAETAARLSYVRESCMAELGVPLDEVAREFAPGEEFDLESSRAYVEELRARIEGFGAVNMMALEELAEAEERLKFLTAQRADITDGIISTEEALREIKRRSRERFRHAFEEINRNFGQFFLELFGGGRGEMSLIDADDVLESGIDIVAQPPGKRLQNVLLLSGGEKAMAALSLVLAIFRYRPSPFCLLDEVDAPLDEANIGRFTAKVSEMSTETQFIVITHNKRTMETARALYGVTMEEVGVSKLVSVRFE